MIVPLILFIISLAGIGASIALPGWSDLALLAGPSALASFLLLLQFLVRALGGQISAKTDLRWPQRTNTQRNTKSKRTEKPNYIILDGSNIMHWKDGTPQIEPLQAGIRHLKSKGYSPGVVFDANAGHILAGRYQHHAGMGKMLGLPEDRVMVVDKGNPADPTILAAARDLGARIVTNDRYRDWAEAHPEIRTPGYLIRGGYHDGTLTLALDDLPPDPRP